MILGLFVICVACLGWAVAVVAARPPTAGGRHDDDRRLRRVYRDPELANLLDIETLLRAEGVPADAVTRVMCRATSHRISARTMWRWADRHGSARLVDALDAGLTEDTMLDHLDAGTAPEWHSVSVFADLANDALPAGLPLDELVDLDAVPTIADLTFTVGLDDWTTHPDDELAGFDSLPPIADPGFGPFSAAEALEVQQAADAEPADDPATEASDDRNEDGGWSAVA
jgi:hypothetical protein